MKKQITLPQAVHERLAGETVTVVLDSDIGIFSIKELQDLEEIGADFFMDIPKDRRYGGEQ